MSESSSDISKILQQYPDRLPIFFRPDKEENRISIKTKWLMPRDTTMGGLLRRIRQKSELTETETLFVFTENGVFIPMYKLLEEVYDEHKSPDQYLYLIYAKENTFGQ